MIVHVFFISAVLLLFSCKGTETQTTTKTPKTTKTSKSSGSADSSSGSEADEDDEVEGEADDKGNGKVTDDRDVADIEKPRPDGTNPGSGSPNGGSSEVIVGGPGEEIGGNAPADRGLILTKITATTEDGSPAIKGKPATLTLFFQNFESSPAKGLATVSISNKQASEFSQVNVSKFELDVAAKAMKSVKFSIPVFFSNLEKTKKFALNRGEYVADVQFAMEGKVAEAVKAKSNSFEIARSRIVFFAVAHDEKNPKNKPEVNLQALLTMGNDEIFTPSTPNGIDAGSYKRLTKGVLEVGDHEIMVLPVPGLVLGTDDGKNGTPCEKAFEVGLGFPNTAWNSGIQGFDKNICFDVGTKKGIFGNKNGFSARIESLNLDNREWFLWSWRIMFGIGCMPLKDADKFFSCDAKSNDKWKSSQILVWHELQAAQYKKSIDKLLGY